MPPIQAYTDSYIFPWVVRPQCARRHNLDSLCRRIIAWDSDSQSFTLLCLLLNMRQSCPSVGLCVLFRPVEKKGVEMRGEGVGEGGFA